MILGANICGWRKASQNLSCNKNLLRSNAAKNFIELCFDNIPVKIVMELMRCLFDFSLQFGRPWVGKIFITTFSIYDSNFLIRD